MKSYLIILRTAPYADSNNAEAIELAMALAAFEQPVNLLFTDAAVLQLIAGQDATLLNQKNYTKAFAGLELFDIKTAFINKDALQQYGNPKLMDLPNAKFIAKTEIQQIISQHDYVIGI